MKEEELWLLQASPSAILEELVEVEPDEELLELALLCKVAHDLVHKARIVPEWVRYVLQLKLGLLVTTDLNAVTTHQEV